MEKQLAIDSYAIKILYMSQDFISGKILIQLSGVILTVENQALKVLLVPQHPGKMPGLPSGRFSPEGHRTLEEGLRDLVEEQTRGTLGYIEQLYTFGNRYRDLSLEKEGYHLLTISYLALARSDIFPTNSCVLWSDLYQFFPWEDHRLGYPDFLDWLIRELEVWAGEVSGEKRKERYYRIQHSFDLEYWDEEKVLPRYELLYEAGLVAEAYRDWNAWDSPDRDKLPIHRKKLSCKSFHPLGDNALIADHRRILASALGRIRGKIKYRPLVYELLPPQFTLLQIQKVVEAISGKKLHKPNFRRLLLNDGFVEKTGETLQLASGRPAAMYKFRKRMISQKTFS